MKIKKGDTVLIISGKDQGKKGKILEVFPMEKRAVVENMNMRKKHVRPKKSGEKGQTIVVPQAIHISNAKVICPRCGKATRVGYRMTDKNKFRVCKKCGQDI